MLRHLINELVEKESSTVRLRNAKRVGGGAKSLPSGRARRVPSWMTGLCVLFFALHAQMALALDCTMVRQIMDVFFKSHYSIHVLDASLSRRTVENFVKTLDPGKAYFYQKDVDVFFNTYAPTLADHLAKSDCSQIDQIFKQFSIRFNDQHKDILKLIDSKHNFKLPEFLNIDRKNLPYTNSSTEMKDRWRKRIKFQHLQLLDTISSESEIQQKLRKRYELMFKHHNALTSDEVYEYFLDAFASSLDPHTSFFSSAQLEEFKIGSSLSLEGIGAVLRSEDGITHVQSLVPGGAAQKAGLVKAGDKIVAVAQGKATPVDVIDMDLQEVVKLIRGPGGTEVRLTIRRDGKDFVAPIVREKVQLQNRAAKSRVYLTEVEAQPKQKQAYKIGIIDLPSFYMDFDGKQNNRRDFRSSSRDVMVEVEKLKSQNVNALVVDLRSNGGGALDEAIKLAGLFTGSGPVVQIKAVHTKTQVETFDDKAIYDGPLIVIIDRQSASASEIMAGAIQDYERGLIVGSSHTFGKGTVQNVNGAIKITVSKFFRPSGSSTQLKGVESDIVFPSLFELYEIGEKHYDFALSWDKIEGTKFPNLKLVSPYVQTLKQASQDRVKMDKGFIEVNKAIEEYKKKEKERMQVSLLLETKKKDEKEKNPAKDQEDLDEFGNNTIRLMDDLMMQEVLRVATDYTRVLKKEKIAPITLVSLEMEKKAEEAKKLAKDKKAASAPLPKVKAKDEKAITPSLEKSGDATLDKTLLSK